MSWKPEVDGIEARREAALEMGGAEAVERQHEKGRLTVRERIEALGDEGSFREQGPIAGYGETDEEGRLVAFTPANYVLGTVSVDGCPCVIGGEDFPQRGGSPTPAGLRKSVYAEELAWRQRLPLVRLLEGGGGSVTGTGGKKGQPRPMGDPVFANPRFESIAAVLETAPVVSVALGAVAGFPAARLAASHLSIMTKQTSQVLIAGPAVVERATGQKLTKDELGGPQIHLKSGVVDNLAEDEDAALAMARRFLSYLPRNVDLLPPRAACDDAPERCEESLLEIIPRDRRKVYKMRKVLEAVFDAGSFFEMSPLYGRSQIVGLARLAGRPVGVFANDPMFYAGAMGAEGAQKVARFLRFCETFHLPVVSFVDEPGFMIGLDSERAGTIRYGVDAIVAGVRSTVPWATVAVRKSYGVAAAAHYGPRGTVFTWPSAEAGALPLEGGVAVAFRREIEAADDPDAKRAELEEMLASKRTPFPRAEAFAAHDLIDPRRTRPVLCDWLELVWPAHEAMVLRGGGAPR